MSVNFKNSHSITDSYLGELGSDHPFGRICCKTRTMQPTVCDGTCGGCKRVMAIFRDTEPTRIKSQDAIQNGGDVAYEPMDLAVYQKNLENRIHKWQQQKGEMVKLLIHTNKRMELIEKQLLSPDVSTTLQ